VLHQKTSGLVTLNCPWLAKYHGKHPVVGSYGEKYGYIEYYYQFCS
jgi:hypothetical protein